MSTALPTLPTDGDFITALLLEQQSLSAVGQFVAFHDDIDSVSHTQAKYYKRLLPATAPRPGHQFAFEVDLDRCSGCKACVVACHTMNGLEDGEAWRRVGTTMTLEPTGRIQHVTTACHHCEEPGCLLGCPVKAYDKDPVTGIVRHLDDQCIGCKYCTMMCPYEVPQYSDRLGIVRKCDMCHQRLAVGEAPACVQGCPNEAISIREVEVGELHDNDFSRIAPEAPLSSITKPTTRYQSANLATYQQSMPQDHALDHVAESHWPLALMLVATQASVGLIIAERLFALAGEILADYSILTTKLAVMIAFLIANAGLGIAPLHLGQPLRAWRVFLGLRTSWLSREAVVLGQYVGLLVAAGMLLWLPHIIPCLPSSVQSLIPTIPGWVAKAALGLALLVGIAGLYSSAMIYVATRRQLWRFGRTMPRFFGTAAVLGPACFVPIAAFAHTNAAATVVVIAIVMIASLAKLCFEIKLVFSKHPHKTYDHRSQRLALRDMLPLTTARFGVGIAAMALLVVAAASIVAGYSLVTIGVATAAALLLTAGELMERLLYFTTVVYDRMPGTIR